jgi:cytochrome P450
VTSHPAFAESDITFRETRCRRRLDLCDEEGDITTTQPSGLTAADVISDLCDHFAEPAAFDRDADPGRAYPVSAVCATLGVPGADWPLFARWAAEFLDPKAIDELYAYLDVMIAERCSRATDDLLSELIRLNVDDDGLTVDDLHTIVAVLVAGAATD